MKMFVSAVLSSCLILVLHVSDTRGYITTKSPYPSNTEEPGFRDVCEILNIITYLLAAIVVVLCLGFAGNQALLIRLRLLQMKTMKSQQDEAHVYNRFQTDRQISRPHVYAQVVPGALGQASPTDSTVRHSYIDILPPDSDDYIKPVCHKCPGNV
ncbi:uncharacterized protein [Haliotis asinina]|uniref:uncharacterized protein n=1 Tax=Haliotis asinina TaxID=109174 RepID=UPI0035325A94